MGKLSAYQKLKAENLKLKQDLIILATEPKSGKGLAIRTKWVIQKNMERSLWLGNAGDLKDHSDFNRFKGVLNLADNGKA